MISGFILRDDDPVDLWAAANPFRGGTMEQRRMMRRSSNGR